jgi:uncharacterized protein YxeA
MKKILLHILCIVVIVGISVGGSYLWFGEKNSQEVLENIEEKTIKNDQEQQTEDKKESVSEEDVVGTYNLEGYMEVEHIFCSKVGMGCDADYDYAFFQITKSDNDLIYDFLGEGNSYLRKDGIGLGCYESDKKRIYSLNRSAETDSGITENIIIGDDLEKLIDSNYVNIIKLQVRVPQPTVGSGAPNCYSHFINFKVLD